jgi:type I restriction enzyme S subunit
LKFFFLSSVGQEELKKRATGTTVVGIRQSELRKVNVVSPPLAEQRAIAGVLGALDDKIELLGAQNRTLEAMARTLFRSWFVRFDPVPERAAGAGVLPLSPEVAALFPAALVDSALGPIPQGWRVLPLDEIADYLNGLALQKYPAQSGDEYLPVIKIAELRRGVTENSGRANLDLPAKYIVDDGDVLFSWSGSLEVVLWSGGRGALNQHLFKVTSATFPRWFYYFWTLHHLPEFQAIAASKATTMGHIQRHHLKQAKVIVPPDETLAAMGEIFSPLLERVLSNLKEARTLAALRDELLPRLLSGALRVPPEP